MLFSLSIQNGITLVECQVLSLKDLYIIDDSLRVEGHLSSTYLRYLCEHLFLVLDRQRGEVLGLEAFAGIILVV